MVGSASRGGWVPVPGGSISARCASSVCTTEAMKAEAAREPAVGIPIRGPPMIRTRDRPDAKSGDCRCSAAWNRLRMHPSSRQPSWTGRVAFETGERDGGAGKEGDGNEDGWQMALHAAGK